MKVLIIVPAYNEEKNIAGSIENLYAENPDWDIVVINDGSLDDTSSAAQSTSKAFVVNLPCNLGIGGAVQTGFRFAAAFGYDAAVQYDGDGQHIASEIKPLLKPLENKECDVVIGSRFAKRHDGWKSSFLRRIGIKVFELLNSMLIMQKITDNTSGFRAYNRAAIEFLSRIYPTDYPEPEAVILLGRNGFKIKEIPVAMKKRQWGRSSISGLRSVYYMTKVILAIFITSIRKRIRK